MNKDQMDYLTQAEEARNTEQVLTIEIDGTQHDLIGDFESIREHCYPYGFDITPQDVVAVNGIYRDEYEAEFPIEGLNGEEEQKAYDTRWAIFVTGEKGGTQVI